MGAKIDADSRSDWSKVDDVIIFFAMLFAAPDETVVAVLREARQ